MQERGAHGGRRTTSKVKLGSKSQPACLPLQQTLASVSRHGHAASRLAAPVLELAFYGAGEPARQPTHHRDNGHHIGVGLQAQQERACGKRRQGHSRGKSGCQARISSCAGGCARSALQSSSGGGSGGGSSTAHLAGDVKVASKLNPQTPHGQVLLQRTVAPAALRLRRAGLCRLRGSVQWNVAGEGARRTTQVVLRAACGATLPLSQQPNCPPTHPPENLTMLPRPSLAIKSWGANRKGKAEEQATALHMSTLGAAGERGCVVVRGCRARQAWRARATACTRVIATAARPALSRPLCKPPQRRHAAPCHPPVR